MIKLISWKISESQKGSQTSKSWTILVCWSSRLVENTPLKEFPDTSATLLVLTIEDEVTLVADIDCLN